MNINPNKIEGHQPFPSPESESKIIDLFPENHVYFQETLHQLQLPALQSRNLLVIRPNERDSKRIIRKLNMVDENIENIRDIVKNNGVFRRAGEFEEYTTTEFAMVIKSPDSPKARGAIHYFFRKGICDVQSVKVHHLYYKHRYGSLLLGSAILDAKANGISKITLQSTNESYAFYISFGFIPEKYASKKKEWQSLLKEERIRQTKKLGKRVTMVLNVYDIEDYTKCIAKAVSNS